MLAVGLEVSPGSSLGYRRSRGQTRFRTDLRAPCASWNKMNMPCPQPLDRPIAPFRGIAGPGAASRRAAGDSVLMGPDAFLGGEPGMPGRIVKNAPFTGDLVTETSQTLGDGNHIHQSTTAHLVRDSEGRTRREQSLNGLGALGAPAANTQAVFISDPVAGVSYALEPNEPYRCKTGGTRPRPRRPQRQATSAARCAALGPRRRTRPRPKTESLGKQTIEGVPADGTRVTQTIAAGRHGQRIAYPGGDRTLVFARSPHGCAHTAQRSTLRRNRHKTDQHQPRRASHALFEPPADYKTVDDRRGGAQQ